MSADLRENTADTQAKQTHKRSRHTSRHKQADTQAKQTALKTNTQISNKDRMANTQQQIPYTMTAQGVPGDDGWLAGAVSGGR